MISLILELVIAIGVSFFIYSWKWWAVSISFPLIMSISNKMYDRPMFESKYRTLTDSIIMFIQIGYIISQIIIFHINIGSWHGWLIGGIVGYILMGMITPKRWATEAKYDM